MDNREIRVKTQIHGAKFIFPNQLGLQLFPFFSLRSHLVAGTCFRTGRFDVLDYGVKLRVEIPQRFSFVRFMLGSYHCFLPSPHLDVPGLARLKGLLSLIGLIRID